MSSNKLSPRMSPRLQDNNEEAPELKDDQGAVVNSIINLNSLYKNLDYRIRKLESIFAEQILVLNNNNNKNSNAINNNNSAITAINHKINNIISTDSYSSSSSSSGESAPITLTGADYNNEYANAAGSICSLLENNQIQKEVSRADLDDYCLSLLQKKASPSIGELNSIVMNMKKVKYPDLDVKFILSKVREWFRRKREYMSQRIINTCTKKISSLPDPNDLEELIKFCQQVRNNPIHITEIVKDANLEIVDDASAYEFCNEKVSIFLDNLLMDINQKHRDKTIDT